MVGSKLSSPNGGRTRVSPSTGRAWSTLDAAVRGLRCSRVAACSVIVVLHPTVGVQDVGRHAESQPYERKRQICSVLAKPHQLAKSLQPRRIGLGRYMTDQALAFHLRALKQLQRCGVRSVVGGPDGVK